jgi:hypothetical protein
MGNCGLIGRTRDRSAQEITGRRRRPLSVRASPALGLRPAPCVMDPAPLETPLVPQTRPPGHPSHPWLARADPRPPVHGRDEIPGGGHLREPLVATKAGGWRRAWSGPRDRSRRTSSCPGRLRSDMEDRPATSRDVADAMITWASKNHRGRRPSLWAPGDAVAVDLGAARPAVRVPQRPKVVR